MVWEILIVLLKTSFDCLIDDRIPLIFLYSLYITNFRPSEGNSSIEIQFCTLVETPPDLEGWFWHMSAYVCVNVSKEPTINTTRQFTDSM